MSNHYGLHVELGPYEMCIILQMDSNGNRECNHMMSFTQTFDQVLSSNTCRYMLFQGDIIL